MPPEELSPDILQAEVLRAFTAQLAETGAVVAESVLNRQPDVHGASLQPATAELLQDTFAALPHIAIEARVALSPAEAHLATIILTRPALAGLLGGDAVPESLTEETAAPIVEQLTAKAREYLDLLTLMLFTDSPIKGEITLSEVRFSEIETTVGMLQDTAAGAPLYRLDIHAGFSDQEPAGMTLLLPATLVTGLVEQLSGDPEPVAQGSDAPDLGSTRVDTASAAEPAASGGPAPINLGGLDDALAGIDDNFEEEDGPPVPVTPIQFPALSQGGQGGAPKPLDLLLDVSMRISVELGRATLTVQELLALGPGSVVELDKLAGEPVDVLVNDRLIARGEVVMVDENFGVRVTEILAPSATPNAAAV